MIKEIPLTALSFLADELLHNKCREIAKLKNREKGSPSWIGIRIQEATKLRQLAEGIRILLIESQSSERLRIYRKLDHNLKVLTNSDPNLKGHIITLGPDKPELFHSFSRVTYQIPITFFKQ